MLLTSSITDLSNLKAVLDTQLPHFDRSLQKRILRVIGELASCSTFRQALT